MDVKFSDMKIEQCRVHTGGAINFKNRIYALDIKAPLFSKFEGTDIYFFYNALKEYAGDLPTTLFFILDGKIFEQSFTLTADGTMVPYYPRVVFLKDRVEADRIIEVLQNTIDETKNEISEPEKIAKYIYSKVQAAAIRLNKAAEGGKR